MVISAFILATQAPLNWLPTNVIWSIEDVQALSILLALLVACMAPLDFLGGYCLPRRVNRLSVKPAAFFASWCRGVTVQATFFMAASLLILALGRWSGVQAATGGVLLIALLLVASQLKIGQLTGDLRPLRELQESESERMNDAMRSIVQLGFNPPEVVLLSHRDAGFTGGVVGLPGLEEIALPVGLVHGLTPEQLAVTVARRQQAMHDGSRTRGILVALTWVVIGFLLSTLIPGAGVKSVAELAMTCLGFTLWTFAGLLILPTLSRQASFALDTQIVNRGTSPATLHRTMSKLDRLQDDEPERAAMIEAIFHPVPSVQRRTGKSAVATPIAWHAARMTLFLSWACMGILVRAVHCNVGRPELWVMLPTD